MKHKDALEKQSKVKREREVEKGIERRGGNGYL